jgi:hypothetical protein
MVPNFERATEILLEYAKKKKWKLAVVKPECPECTCFTNNCSDCPKQISKHRCTGKWPTECAPEDCVLAKIAARELKEYDILFKKYLDPTSQG